MRILVIGGSYFYGRVFVMLASEKHDITVVNRGTYSMEEFGVRQIRGDRHDAALWKECGGRYDAVVDFCAYRAGEIETVLKNLPETPGQYLLISTVDVYRRTGIRTIGDLERETPEKTKACAEKMGDIRKDETFPLEDRRFPGEAGDYISGKVALERELRRVCGEREIPFTVLRPAILYGPYNYAPRESLLIRMAVREKALPRFTDADGRFQFVYVKDAAEAILRCLGNERSYRQAYNLCGEEILDYDLFFRELGSCITEGGDNGRASAGLEDVGDNGGASAGSDNGAELRKGDFVLRELPMTLAEAGERGIPVPFPATAEETELVSNRRSREELGMEYTPLSQGMRKTCRAFRRVYEG